MLNPTLSKQQGQGLVETLITLLIIVLGALAVIRFQNYLTYTNSFARQQSDATLLALQKIESLRDFQVINNTSGYTSYQSIASGSSTTNGTTATYTVAWTVTTNSNPAYKTIDTTVSWPDVRNTTRSVRLVTRVGSVDPANSAAVK